MSQPTQASNGSRSACFTGALTQELKLSLLRLSSNQAQVLLPYARESVRTAAPKTPEHPLARYSGGWILRVPKSPDWDLQSHPLGKKLVPPTMKAHKKIKNIRRSAPTCLRSREKKKSINMSDNNEKIKYPTQSPNLLCILFLSLILLTFLFSLFFFFFTPKYDNI